MNNKNEIISNHADDMKTVQLFSKQLRMVICFKTIYVVVIICHSPPKFLQLTHQIFSLLTLSQWRRFNAVAAVMRMCGVPLVLF